MQILSRKNETAADQFAGKVKDITEFLDELGLITDPELDGPLTAVYQDACHLAHAQGIRENECIVSKGGSGSPRIPAYAGGRFPLSTYLAGRVRALMAEPRQWATLPDTVREWLRIQQWRSLVPGARDLLVEE